jgi:hypothetical protein
VWRSGSELNRSAQQRFAFIDAEKVNHPVRALFRVLTHSHPVAPDVLNRVFEADAPNQAWVTEITSVCTGQR